MKEVIYLDNRKEEEVKPVEFTHLLNSKNGWGQCETHPSDFGISKVVYLGKCDIDGDMFAVYFNTGVIAIYKGHLNSGKY